MGDTGMLIFHSRLWVEPLKTEVVCWPILKLLPWQQNYIAVRVEQKSGLLLERAKILFFHLGKGLETRAMG